MTSRVDSVECGQSGGSCIYQQREIKRIADAVFQESFCGTNDSNEYLPLAVAA